MERIQKQWNGLLSAVRRRFGGSALAGGRELNSGDGFTRWLREFEVKNRAAMMQSQAKFRKP